MAFLYKLKTKNASKFNFSISIESIDHFHSGANVSSASRPSSSTFCLRWKRGTKRHGQTEYKHSFQGKVVYNESFTFNGTLYKTKNGFLKKKLNFELYERAEKEKGDGKIIGEAHMDISGYCNLESEVTDRLIVILDMRKKGTGEIHLLISSSKMSESVSTSTLMSTMDTISSTNDLSEMSESEEPERRLEITSNTTKSNRKKSVTSPMQDETKYLKEEIEQLKQKVYELESVCKKEVDSSELILSLQMERSSFWKVMKDRQMEIDSLRKERDQALASMKESKNTVNKLKKGLGDFANKVMIGRVASPPTENEVIEDKLDKFIRAEVIQKIPEALFHNERLFTYPEIIAARLSILKAMVLDGTLSEEYLINILDTLDLEMCKTLTQKEPKTSKDHIDAKLTINSFEEFLNDIPFLQESNRDHKYFKHTRQYADFFIIRSGNDSQISKQRK